ncbi:response regulator receiver protein [Kribbella flavida DSM 17836]|uniref:Response regulator receiver protein n=1 Tax=Kribbella flavida (strain DSM 17836 / JCM 10339 / NBRC 14399) TaxID=479435 RepID=D2Q4X2_KRIFD|nr:HD domain-containing phosphohydrolase [Kribbella flavida]ADB34227.1 response regulator receiver protein [Kribbella flavida DSM 17836]
MGSGVVIVLAGGCLGLTAVLITMGRGLSEWPVALAFGFLIAVGEMVQFRVDRSRNRAPIATSAALGYAMLRGPSVDVPPEVAQVIAVTAVATLAGILPRAVAGLWWDVVVSCRRLISVACAAVVFAAVTSPSLSWNGTWQHALPLALAMLLSVLTAAGVDALVGAGQATEQDNRPFPAALRDELAVVGRIGMAMAIGGVLLAAGTSVLGLWAPPLVLVPLLLTQFAFRRYASAQRTYRTTVRSMARSTEIAGFSTPGQNARTASLAVALGNDLGLTPSRMEALEYAALLSGVGQLALADPSPGGASLLRSREERQRAAEIGASVIERSGVLDHVAEIVRHSNDPYRHGRANNSKIPVESGIVNVALAYEQLVGEGTGQSPEKAMESIGLGIGAEYDPVVVESLRRVVGRGFRF